MADHNDEDRSGAAESTLSIPSLLSPGQRFGFHNLRHSLATFLVNKGADVKTVQGLLRHANVTTTLGRYAQSVSASMLEAQEIAIQAMRAGSGSKTGTGEEVQVKN